jgi:hypothetical protein
VKRCAFYGPARVTGSSGNLNFSPILLLSNHLTPLCFVDILCAIVFDLFMGAIKFVSSSLCRGFVCNVGVVGVE